MNQRERRGAALAITAALLPLVSSGALAQAPAAPQAPSSASASAPASSSAPPSQLAAPSAQGPAPASSSAAPSPSASASAPSPSASASAPSNEKGQLAANLARPGDRVNTWDLNIDLGYGHAYTDPSFSPGLARVRGGVLFIREPLYMSLGLTYEYSGVHKATFGLQGELMHLETGLWAQAGGLLDTQPKPGFMVSAGWSLFGVELQRRDIVDHGTATVVYGKIRIPISIIARAF